MDIVNTYMNPLHYISNVAFSHFWKYAFHTFLKGVIAKVVSGLCLVVALWFLFKKESITGFFTWFLVSVFIAFLGGIIYFISQHVH